MGFSSQAGHVAFRTQASGGTFATDFATKAIAMRLKSGALSTNRDLLIPDAEIGGGRDVSDAFLGAVHWAGDYEFYTRLRALPTLLRAALGDYGGLANLSQQTITPSGTWTSGNYTLTFNGQTTGNIAYNADAAAIQTALEALSTIAPGEVIVSGGPLSATGPVVPVVVQFTGALWNTTKTLTISVTGIVGGGTAAITTAENGTFNTRAKQTITPTGTWTSGTYTLTFNGETTAGISYDANAATIQAALEALTGIAANEAVVTGGPLSATGPVVPVVITFAGAHEDTTCLVSIDVTSIVGGGTATVAATATTTYTHTFTASDDASLPFLSIEEAIGAGLEVFNYTDAVVNTLHLESEANGYLSGTVGIIAKRQEAGITPLDVSSKTDESEMIVGTNITVTYNGVGVAAKSFSFDVNNNFDTDDYRLGSLYLGDLTPKRRDITVGVSLREASSANWRQASYGSSAATVPGGTVTKADLAITMETYTSISGSDPSRVYALTLTFPDATIKPYTLETSGDDIIDSDIEFQILRPLVATSAVTAVVRNAEAEVY